MEKEEGIAGRRDHMLKSMDLEGNSEGLGVAGMSEVWRKQQEVRLVKQALLSLFNLDLASKHL